MFCERGVVSLDTPMNDSMVYICRMPPPTRFVPMFLYTSICVIYTTLKACMESTELWLSRVPYIRITLRTLMFTSETVLNEGHP